MNKTFPYKCINNVYANRREINIWITLMPLQKTNPVLIIKMVNKFKNIHYTNLDL